MQGADEGAMAKFLEDEQMDDKAQTNMVFKAIICGENRKRKRGDIDMDEEGGIASKRRQRMEERMAML